MPKFEITLKRTVSKVVVMEFDTEEEAEAFASEYDWDILDGDDVEDDCEIIELDED